MQGKVLYNGEMMLQKEEEREVCICTYQEMRASEVSACAASSSSFVAIEDPSTLTSPTETSASTCLDRLTVLVVLAWEAMACDNVMLSASPSPAFGRFLGLGLVG